MANKGHKDPKDLDFFRDLFYIYKNYRVSSLNYDDDIDFMMTQYGFSNFENFDDIDDDKGFRLLFFQKELKEIFLQEFFDWDILKKDNLSLIRTPSYKGLGHSDKILKYKIEPSLLINRTLESFIKLFSSYSRKFFYQNDQIRIQDQEENKAYKGLPGSIIPDNEFWSTVEKTYFDYKNIEYYNGKADMVLPLLKALKIKFHGIGMPEDDSGNSVKIFFEKEGSPYKVALEVKVDKLSVYLKNIDLYKSVGRSELKNPDLKDKIFPLSVKSPESFYLILGKRKLVKDPLLFKHGMLIISHKLGHQVRDLILLMDQIFEGQVPWKDSDIDLQKILYKEMTLEQSKQLNAVINDPPPIRIFSDERFIFFLQTSNKETNNLN